MEQENELVKLMKEMVRLQKIMVKPIIKKLVESNLDKPAKLVVYDMTDGVNTREGIMKKTGSSAGAISSWWNDWASKGLIEKEDGKYRQIFSLADLGIRSPIKRIIKVPLDEEGNPIQSNFTKLKERIQTGEENE